MTEYEVADLAVSTKAIFFQQWDLAQGLADRAYNLIQYFGNLLFAYLIVAYFVGANLSRVQSVILNILYLSWQARVFFMLNGLFANTNILLGDMKKISPRFAHIHPAYPSPVHHPQGLAAPRSTSSASGSSG